MFLGTRVCTYTPVISPLLWRCLSSPIVFNCNPLRESNDLARLYVSSPCFFSPPPPLPGLWLSFPVRTFDDSAFSPLKYLATVPLLHFPPHFFFGRSLFSSFFYQISVPFFCFSVRLYPLARRAVSLLAPFLPLQTKNPCDLAHWSHSLLYQLKFFFCCPSTTSPNTIGDVKIFFLPFYFIEGGLTAVSS